MRKIGLILLSVALPLSMAGCSNDEPEDESQGLTPGQSTAAPVEPLPEPPLNTLEEDLTNPEGTVTAYMTYLQLGDGLKTCALFTDKLANQYGGRDNCVSEVQTYAAAVLPDFEDSLDVAQRVTVKIQTNDGTNAKGGAAVAVNQTDGTNYYEGFTLTNVNGTWLIDSLTSVEATDQIDGRG